MLERNRCALGIADALVDAECGALTGLRHFDGALDRQFPGMKQIEVRNLLCQHVGIGKSGNIGAKLAATLTSTGSPTVLLNSVDALHGDLGIINDGDLLLALSYSGESDELLNLLPAFKRFAVRLKERVKEANAAIRELGGKPVSYQKTLAEYSAAAERLRHPLVAREGQLNLLLTQRTVHLSAHAGQISFPGGRFESDDADD